MDEELKQEQLHSLIDSVIKQDDDQFRTDFHAYLQAKMKDIVSDKLSKD